MQTIRHLLRLALSAVAFGLLAASCADSASVYTDAEPAEEPQSTIMLHVAPVTLSRADGASAIRPEDLIYSLRVMIFDKASGEMLYNDYGNVGGDTVARRIYACKPQQLVRIHLVANEEATGLTPQLNAATKEADLENLEFKFPEGDPSTVFSAQNAIPMSAVYEVTLPSAGRIDYRDFFLAKAAVKFSFRYQNTRIYPLKLVSVSLTGTADTEYLFGHVYGDDVQKDFNGATLPWIDWLKNVSDESQPNLTTDFFHEDLFIPSKRPWIMNYTVPQNANHNALTFPGETLEMEACPIGQEATAKVYETHKQYYAAESRRLLNEQGDQTYTLTVVVEEQTTDQPETHQHTFTATFSRWEIEPEKFISWALFRNTHVIFDLRFGDDIKVQANAWEVVLHPYTGIELDPIFGLDPGNPGLPDDTDENGNIIPGSGGKGSGTSGSGGTGGTGSGSGTE